MESSCTLEHGPAATVAETPVSCSARKHALPKDERKRQRERERGKGREKYGQSFVWVKILIQNEDGKLRTALVGNLKSAVTASFLMLPESFSEDELYHQIAGLGALLQVLTHSPCMSVTLLPNNPLRSRAVTDLTAPFQAFTLARSALVNRPPVLVSGDFRMVIGEDKSKVSNIVKDNLAHFRILYSNILQECPQVVYKPQQGKLEVQDGWDGMGRDGRCRLAVFYEILHLCAPVHAPPPPPPPPPTPTPVLEEQNLDQGRSAPVLEGCSVDKSPEGQFTQLMALPRTLQQRITRLVDPPGKNRDVEEILLQVAQDPDCATVVQQGQNGAQAGYRMSFKLQPPVPHPCLCDTSQITTFGS
ncbi:hypothetical protein JZ751_028704 [Albula glossodonta]|uniref:Phosphatidate cytidylyltransferase, mitochondrial n=1 Tax=Albula glossodonta TaxID=121402 RepID=A0A8T2MZU2_9TELE|nr:hypothetical protein JZ751_028704 [Albula glossodonta]